MKLLKEKYLACFEKDCYVDTDGPSRYADTVSFPKTGKSAIILDPTVIFESNVLEQASKVKRKKKKVY